MPYLFDAAAESWEWDAVSIPVTTGLLAAPTGLAASAGAPVNSVALDWADYSWPSGSTNRRYEVHEDLFAGFDNLVATVTVSNRTSGSLQTGAYRYFIVAKCDLANGSPAVSSPSTPLSVTVPIPPDDYTPDSGQIHFDSPFTGSGNGLAPWPWIDVHSYSGSVSGYTPTYSYQVVDDATYTKAARVEVRTGDTAAGSNERAELASNVGTSGSLTGGGEGTVFWYEFAIQFDSAFPLNHPSLGWGAVMQFKTPGAGSPPVGWYVDNQAGMMTLIANRQSSPNVYLGFQNILHLPLNRGVWQRISMRVKYSTSDSVGELSVWLNQVPQTLISGSTTTTVRTLVPSAGGPASVKMGYYRKAGIAPTGIVKFAQFRTALAQTGLRWELP